MRIWHPNKKIVLGVVIVIFLTLLVFCVEEERATNGENGSLHRLEKGNGDYETELILEIDGGRQTEWMITVPEQRLSEEMEQEYLSSAIKEIEKNFLKENKSLEVVRNEVAIDSSYQAGNVLAEWKFSNPDVITADGKIDEEVMVEESEEVMATVFLTCEDSHIVYEFCFVIWRREKTEDELFYESTTLC